MAASSRFDKVNVCNTSYAPVDELYVRVEKNWRNQEQKIKEFGLDELNEAND